MGFIQEIWNILLIINVRYYRRVVSLLRTSMHRTEYVDMRHIY